MKKQRIAIAFSVLLACVVAAPAAAALADDPSDQDQVFFDELQRQGLHPEYDKQICGSVRCESLRNLLVQQGHAVCTALSNQPRLVPVSVIGNLEVSPDEAHAIINAARLAYCPQLPDPYVRSR